MLRYLGQSTVEKIGEWAGLTPEDREVAAYGLEYLISSIAGLALMLLIGFALSLLLETLAVLSCWVLLRVFAGGAHCTALWRCTVVNCAGILAALFITRGVVFLLPPVFWVAAASAWALLAAGLWAPNNSERPVYDPRRRKVLRRRALVLIVVTGSLLLYSVIRGAEQGQLLAAAGATGLASGGFMISPAGFRLINRLNHSLEFLGNSIRKGGETP